MTISLITEGMIGGGGGSPTDPTITAVSPTPDTPAGASGGMPADLASAAQTEIVVEVSDTAGADALTLVGFTAVFVDGTELVYRDGVFAVGYNTNSYVESVTDGFKYHLRRNDGWPGAVVGGSALAVEIVVDVATDDGGSASGDFSYQMPTGSGSVVSPIPTSASSYVDHVAAALSRVPNVWR